MYLVITGICETATSCDTVRRAMPICLSEQEEEEEGEGEGEGEEDSQQWLYFTLLQSWGSV